jgi:hypothetical protein
MNKRHEKEKNKMKRNKERGKKNYYKKTRVVNSQQIPTLARGNQGG